MKSGVALKGIQKPERSYFKTLVIVPSLPVTVVVVQFVMPELYSPLPLPGPPKAKFAAFPRAAKVVCGFSREAPIQKRLPKFWTKRTPYCRAQLKPTRYIVGR